MHTSFSKTSARQPLRRSPFRRVLWVMLGALSLAPLQAAVAQTDDPDFYVVSNSRRGQSTLATLRPVNQFGTPIIVADNRRRITGLQNNEQILGIDFRPATGQLYGLGSSSRLYLIDTDTAVATQVGNPFAISLSGSSFGFDFNPAVDRIRVTSDAGQNLRLNPITGSVVDFNMATPAIDADGNLSYGNSVAPNVAGSAYTNSDNDPTTGTLLFNIDTVQDALVTQGSADNIVSPNSGRLFTVGGLGFDAASPLGFDIVTSNGTNTAYAVFANRNTARNFTPSVSTLFTINLATGAATPLGTIINEQNIVGFAIETPASVVVLN